jgi:hypothetical protein
MRRSRLTRTDQKFLSRDFSILWNCMPGLDGSACKSKTVTFTAFCSSLVSRARLAVNVSAMRKCIHYTLNTFITSSPRWLITLTAMRPDAGFAKGREVSLFNVAQASSLISALRVVLSAL